MAKVSIGVRGWRFDEDVVFEADGEMRPLTDMPEDTRNRLIRLSSVLGEPCDACWLVHGTDGIAACNVVDIVYGEPMAEVLLCDDHEADFLYWFREAGGREFAGTGDLPERFHEWFDDGNRAPEGYAGIDHVDTEPDALPEATDDEGIDDVDRQVGEMSEAEREALDVNLDDLDV